MIWDLFRRHGRRRGGRPGGKRRRAFRPEFESLEDRRLLSAGNLVGDVLVPPDAADGSVAEANAADGSVVEVGPGADGQQAEDRLPFWEYQARSAAVYDALSRGVLPSEAQLGELVADGARLGAEIQRVAGADPGSQYFLDLVSTQGGVVYTLDCVLLARRVADLTAGMGPNLDDNQVEDRLPLDDYQALYQRVVAGLYRGELPSDQDFGDLAAAGQRLGGEIQRVAGVDPGGQYLIDLVWAQSGVVYTLDRVLLAQRMAGQGNAAGAPVAGNEAEDRLPLGEYEARLAEVHGGLYRGDFPSEAQLGELLAIGGRLSQEIQRVAGADPGSQYLVELGLVQLEFAYVLDKALLARRVAGLDAGAGLGDDAAPAGDRLPLDDYQALSQRVAAGLYRGELPSDQDFGDLAAAGQRLGAEIQRVAGEEPGGQYLIDLVRAQLGFAATLDRVLLARRVADLTAGMGPNLDDNRVEDDKAPLDESQPGPPVDAPPSDEPTGDGQGPGSEARRAADEGPGSEGPGDLEQALAELAALLQKEKTSGPSA